ncbi:hypothetical protein [Phaffia rhodozyma]|uniref:Uncharacterized protein n=1 Tax=Phaffia rhodozyma TaxID=264483 RepID=A0A0F7SUT9_PHARH|nr:hypothetical protein [Phaffia rhodozyma]
MSLTGASFAVETVVVERVFPSKLVRVPFSTESEREITVHKSLIRLGRMRIGRSIFDSTAEHPFYPLSLSSFFVSFFVKSFSEKYPAPRPRLVFSHIIHKTTEKTNNEYKKKILRNFILFQRIHLRVPWKINVRSLSLIP